MVFCSEEMSCRTGIEEISGSLGLRARRLVLIANYFNDRVRTNNKVYDQRVTNDVPPEYFVSGFHPSMCKDECNDRGFWTVRFVS